MTVINIGVLAHVDAGKTSLTERLLFEAGVIPEPGRVDHGTTRTDTLELERQRGITIKTAVISFSRGSITFNIVDTPGHADFIAEVDRSLAVLDGVIVVISAVEGIQPQTRRLIAAVRALDLPLVLFVNKIDRAGVRWEPLLEQIRDQLGLTIVAMTRPLGLGSREVRVEPLTLGDAEHVARLTEVLADNDDAVMARYVDGAVLTAQELDDALRCQVAEGRVVPVTCGSAFTGAGVRALLDRLESWFTAPDASPDVPLSGTVFKIQRAPGGERLAYVRVFAGTLRTRDVVELSRQTSAQRFETIRARVTAIETSVDGSMTSVRQIGPGEVGQLHGMDDVRIGDVLGEVPPRSPATHFSPPTLERAVAPSGPTTRLAMFAALKDMAEQDPLIALRVNEQRGNVSVRLFGDVQKEILDATLRDDYGVSVAFSPSEIVCVETPAGSGYAIEHMGAAGNPFAGTVGIRIEPAAASAGISFSRPSGALPLAFYVAIEETVYQTLHEGLAGWDVIDCHLEVTETAYSDPVTVAADFRGLTPLVLMEALRIAGTRIMEPVETFVLDTPTETVGGAIHLLTVAGAVLGTAEPSGQGSRITGTVPTRSVADIERQLPHLSRGEGVFRSQFGGYAEVRGDPPRRERSRPDALNRLRYLADLSQR